MKIAWASEKKIKEFPDTDPGLKDFWTEVKKAFPELSKTKPQNIMNSENQLKKRWDRIVGGGRNQGCRAPKKTDNLCGSMHIIELTRAWHEMERRMGHDVDATDILNDYMDRCEYTFKLMEKRGATLGKD